MLIIKNLSKKFKNKTAVDDLSFTVKEGKIFGLLGPNGAGKTTTIRILLDIIKADSGEIIFERIGGNELKDRVGYLPEERGLYRKSKVLDVIIYFAQLKGMTRQDAQTEAMNWLRKFELDRYTKYSIEQLSKGNQQKVQFIISIVHNPELLILDEPFSGFDPINQQTLKEIIANFISEGKLLILSTHMLEIAESLCQDILLINNGKEVISGSISDIKNKFGESIYRITFSGDQNILLNHKMVEKIFPSNSYTDIALKPDVDVSEFIKDISSLLALQQFTKVEPTLTNIFLQSVRQHNSAETS